jgi:hypothetical protein
MSTIRWLYKTPPPSDERRVLKDSRSALIFSGSASNEATPAPKMIYNQVQVVMENRVLLQKNKRMNKQMPGCIDPLRSKKA